MNTMLATVKKRLESLHITVTNDDDWLLNFLIEKVSDFIENGCNVDKIPDNLYFFAVDMVVAEFISNKKSVGKLTGIEVATAIKTIKEGDTSITYAVADGADSLESLILDMKKNLENQFATFRRLVW
jgi:hypothetical protein